MDNKATGDVSSGDRMSKVPEIIKDFPKVQPVLWEYD
jgi:hypothetical protein